MRYPTLLPNRLVGLVPVFSILGLGACGLNPFSGDDSATSAEPVVAQTSVQQSTPARSTAPSYSAPGSSSQTSYQAPARTSYQAPAQTSRPVRLRANHPDQYTVVRGDTLWDISARFLEDPWLWPEIWQVNPQIDNPHLIYPGDIISLVYVDGRPQLRLQRGAPGLRTERLSPQMRVESLDQAIQTIPYELIRPFLSRPTVLSKDEVKNLPYILSTKGHLIAGSNYEVYVRGEGLMEGARYSVLHIGDKLRDPESGDTLGYAGIYVGEGRLTRGGDPATLYLRQTEREALEGDRLMVADVQQRLDFIPRAPDQLVEGAIMSVIDGVSLIGQYQIVALNRGSRHGLAPGHVLSIYQAGEKVRDTYRSGLVGGLLGGKIRLPEEHAGELMVFKTYDRMSYALVMKATSEIRVGDRIRTP